MRWKNQEDTFKESIQYIEDRRQGKIISLQTPWKSVNKIGVEGFEFPSTIIIAGRPASGKSLAAQQIVRHAFHELKIPNTRALRFEYEMVGRVSAIREFSSVLNKSYSYICNAEEQKMSDEEVQACIRYSKSFGQYPIDIIDDPLTVIEMSKEIDEYMMTYNPDYLVITIDHSLLVKRLPGQDVSDMIFDLGTMMTRKKKKYQNIIFIVLSQLNRNVDQPERTKEGTAGNYIYDSDIFGSDYLLQFSDIVIGLNRPALKNIRYYGPERFVISGADDLIMHYLKVRNGDPGMSFFKARFEHMSIDEVVAPGKSLKAIRF
jgi:replicative DNA helicase